MTSHFNPFKKTLTIHKKSYDYYSLDEAESQHLGEFSKLPFSLKILVENLLRHYQKTSVTKEMLQSLGHWHKTSCTTCQIPYYPSRVLMQDFTGIPAVVDLAAMRDAMKALGGDPATINPLCPVDLVIDHSIQVDTYGNAHAFNQNVEKEMQRNKERYTCLKWAQQAFTNFRVVPPGTGICHQVNLEYLAKVIHLNTGTSNTNPTLYPDTLVGTDSHTTMINGLGVLGWGVGGIEAEAAMLGQALMMRIPDVIGVKLIGSLNDGVTATDLVLTITQRLRAYGVVGKFVEFFGPALSELSLPERATIANMAPEYGATCGIFPVDDETLRYLHLTGREAEHIQIIEHYCKTQSLFYTPNDEQPCFTDIITINLEEILPCLAGPKRPQDRVLLSNLPATFQSIYPLKKENTLKNHQSQSQTHQLHAGDVVIAAITSCTNTSNPSVLITAGLLAKKAVELGLCVKPWVKTSLAPGSKVVTNYLIKLGLMPYLEKLGFHLVGYGCTTCIGNSGPLESWITDYIELNNLPVSAVLSGNRNFEGRIHPLIQANWLASPPLVIAFALAGSVLIDLENQPLGYDKQGNPVNLADLWPSHKTIQQAISKITQQQFTEEYADIFKGEKAWQSIEVNASCLYSWDQASTYIRRPPFFEKMIKQNTNFNKKTRKTHLESAHILALLGDSITTDHISPAGAIAKTGPTADYFKSHSILPQNFNSYGARRGNHEVMMRGTFSNLRLQNQRTPDLQGGWTYYKEDTKNPIRLYDAAMHYMKENIPVVVFAGKEYGTGSSRDWAAKGSALLGIQAIIAESFERIHRANLVGMGVLPLTFLKNMTWKKLNLQGPETITIEGLDKLKPQALLNMHIYLKNKLLKSIQVCCCIQTDKEINYYYAGGILPYVLMHKQKKMYS